MQISVKTMTGKIMTLRDWHTGDLVINLKKEVYCWTSIPPDQQQLTFTGRLLEDNMPLWHYDISEGAMLEVQHVGTFT